MAKTLKCARCRVEACRAEPGAKKTPSFCPTKNEQAALERAAQLLAESEQSQALAAAAARVEATGYGRWPRVQEVVELARRLQIEHVGIACCCGLLREAELAQEIFEAQGLIVSSVCCKAGSTPKEQLGLEDEEKIRPGTHEPMCNPIAQAELLAEAQTELNVAIGLCVGHDSLFFAHSHVPVTVLVAKDRVTGHNPAAALYTSHSYYKRLREPLEEE